MSSFTQSYQLGRSILKQIENVLVTDEMAQLEQLEQLTSKLMVVVKTWFALADMTQHFFFTGFKEIVNEVKRGRQDRTTELKSSFSNLMYLARFEVNLDKYEFTKLQKALKQLVENREAVENDGESSSLQMRRSLSLNFLKTQIVIHYAVLLTRRTFDDYIQEFRDFQKRWVMILFDAPTTANVDFFFRKCKRIVFHIERLIEVETTNGSNKKLRLVRDELHTSLNERFSLSDWVFP